MANCKHPGCDYPVRGHGHCNMHHLRHKRGQDMDAPRRGSSAMPVEERFWLKVNKGDDCWEWAGSKLRGYGQFRYKGATRYAHRVIYELTYGPIPEGMHVDHTCWSRGCVRPEHLRLLTQAENNQNHPGARIDSTSGVRGARWDPEKRKYEARAAVRGVTTHLGYFADLREAEKVLIAWRRDNMPYSIADQRHKQFQTGPTGSFFVPETAGAYSNVSE